MCYGQPVSVNKEVCRFAENKSVLWLATTRGHGKRFSLPKGMHIDFFVLFFSFLKFFLSASALLTSLLLHSYPQFVFWSCLFGKVSREFEKRQSQRQFSVIFLLCLCVCAFVFCVCIFLLAFESFYCPPSMSLRTDTKSIEGHRTGIYRDAGISTLIFIENMRS